MTRQTWTDEEIEEMCLDSVVESSRCPECGHSWPVEPDAEGYTCEECGEGLCHSPLIVLGLI